MNALQGYVLFSSDRGGMRIEYAKNKMGEVSQTTISVSIPHLMVPLLTPVSYSTKPIIVFPNTVESPFETTSSSPNKSAPLTIVGHRFDQVF